MRQPSPALRHTTNALILSSGLATAAHGAILVQGSFDNDDAVASQVFSLDAAAKVELRSLGFAGGLGAHGHRVAAGGFASVLSVFDGFGLLLATDSGSGHDCNDAGTGAADPASGLCWDAFLSLNLQAGDYLAVISQDGNVPVSPYACDPFSRTGEWDYTGQMWGRPGATFVNADGSQRSGDWAFMVDAGSTPQPVPEPGSLPLAVAGLATGLATLHRRRLRPGRAASWLAAGALALGMGRCRSRR
jgi:hypothetical protein